MSLFPRPQQQPNPLLNRLQDIKRMASGNPKAYYDNLIQNNQQFASFVRENEGKSLEQIARENGIDWTFFQSLM